MNDLLFETSQQKLYRWLTHRKEPTLSYSTIQLAAKNLINQYHPEIEEKEAWNYLFLPLLRSGAMFFCGKKRYALSPAVQLIGRQNCLLVNTFEFGEALRDRAIWTAPGQLLLVHKQIQNIPDHIPSIHFTLSPLLKRIPPIKQLVRINFRESQIPNQALYRKQDGRWIKCAFDEKLATGVYKSGEHLYSPQYLVLEETCFDVPGLDENPDAITLANMASQIANQKMLSGISYDTKGELLRINTPFFPVEIEKLLYLHTVLTEYQIKVNGDSRIYAVPARAFRQLDYIFHQKIPMT